MRQGDMRRGAPKIKMLQTSEQDDDEGSGRARKKGSCPREKPRSGDFRKRPGKGRLLRVAGDQGGGEKFSSKSGRTENL